MIETICDGLMLLGMAILVSMIIVNVIREIRKNKQEGQKATPNDYRFNGRFFAAAAAIGFCENIIRILFQRTYNPYSVLFTLVMIFSAWAMFKIADLLEKWQKEKPENEKTPE